MARTTGLDELLRACIDPATPAILKTERALLEDDALGCKLQELGYFAARIDAQPVGDKKQLLRVLNTYCHFPWYFGFNWDALADCLADLRWLPANGYILVFVHLEQMNRSDLRTFLDIIISIRETWASVGVAFKLVMPDSILDSNRIE